MTDTPDLMGALTPPERPLDIRGYRRSPATMPEFRQGKPPGNKGRRYPPDMPTPSEMVLLLNGCTSRPSGRRLRALIVLLWRTGMRISEALQLEEHDLDRPTGAITIRRGKGGKARIVGMDEWAWDEIESWLEYRRTLPIGPLFCIVDGPTTGTRAVGASSVRTSIRKLVVNAGIRRRIHPHAFRHCLAVELMRERISVYLIQRQLGHENLAITTKYLRSIPNSEVVEAIHSRRAPVAPIAHIGGER